jgi:hypothetical protein
MDRSGGVSAGKATLALMRMGVRSSVMRPVDRVEGGYQAMGPLAT